MMKRTVCLLSLTLCLQLAATAQVTDNDLYEDKLKDYIEQYQPATGMGRSTLQSVRVDSVAATVNVYTTKAFGSMVFTTLLRDRIYGDVRRLLPPALQGYKLSIYSNGRLIDGLIPNFYRVDKDSSRLWGDTGYKGRPWVTGLSRPYRATRGLYGHHISLWASHGIYYDNDSRRWQWQRPPLYGTREDFLSQTFVVPYLIPMLENAGAVVFTPRERDWQPHEAVVDNDDPWKDGEYRETTAAGYQWATTTKTGFACKHPVYFNNMNPFEDGTARSINTAYSQDGESTAEWMPDIPADGDYAVYVSYQTLYNSVDDALYTVCHKGGATKFRVNQQMGGGTWVYLGTFRFAKGRSDQAKVILSNRSRMRSGVVTADAVRFGGGMGNVARGATVASADVSGMPRYLEGARYYAQWAGMPYDIYSGYDGANDYKDDINTRSFMTNYLAGGSPYVPGIQGLKVPLEVSIAFHTDAGFNRNDSFIGSLGICSTTDGDQNDKLPSGISRMASRDLADIILTGIRRDLKNECHIDWNVRGIKDDNYSESFRPQVPSVITEMLSHQNFADMKYAHDPNFKFVMARSIYKSILEYLTSQHGVASYTVQPLPVGNFSLSFMKGKGAVRLSWTPTEDKDERTAHPTGYIVYTRIGDGGFDNGTYCTEPTLTLPIEARKIYSFKVAAVNSGGESFPSETLSACHVPESKRTVLIVNGFHRLSAPATIDDDDNRGFDLKADPGVAYVRTAGFCGYQRTFSRKYEGSLTAGGTGYTDNALVGQIIAGNSFDYPYVHGLSVQACGCSFVSCSDEAVKNRKVLLTGYQMVDWIAGLQKYDKSGIVRYECFSPAARRAIAQYARTGGKLFVSGAYIGSGLTGEQEKAFTRNVLKYTCPGSVSTDAYKSLSGNGVTFAVRSELNDSAYSVASSDCLRPVAPAFTTFSYSDSDEQSASAAYLSPTFNCFSMGVPFEGIATEEQRNAVMKTVVEFLFRKTAKP